MQPVNRSVQRLAKIAGALYLVNIVAGAFAIGFVSSVAPTIQANEALLRAGVAAHPDRDSDQPAADLDLLRALQDRGPEAGSPGRILHARWDRDRGRQPVRAGRARGGAGL